MSASRSEYMRARRNAQARYNRLLNKGYAFSENPIPAIPKKITEGSIRRLNALTARELRGKASWGVSIETGELVTPLQAYNEQRRRTSAKQSETQKYIADLRRIDVSIAEYTLGRKRRKGESPTAFIKEAKEYEAEVKAYENYAYFEEELNRKTPREIYDEHLDAILDKHYNDIKKKLRDEYGVNVPPEWSNADVMAYYHYVRGYGGPHPELPKDDGFTPISSSPFDKMTEDEYDIEIENAYDSGEYETARQLEKERDEYYPKEEADFAEMHYEARFQDAIDVINQYSPEIADRLKESLEYYMTRKGGVVFDEGLTSAQKQAFELALGQLEDAKYASNQMAMWSIYTKLDKALNSRHHSRAERMQFFGKIQSGDFQYE